MQIAQCYFRFLHGGIEEHILNLGKIYCLKGYNNSARIIYENIN